LTPPPPTQLIIFILICPGKWEKSEQKPKRGLRMQKYGGTISIFFMLAVLACNNSKLNMVNENDPWDKYAGIERYWDHIEKILPFYNHINEHFRQTVNPEQLPPCTYNQEKEL